MGTYLNIKYKSLICLTPRMTLEMNPRIRCWTSRGRYGSGPDSADIFFGVWCENMVSAFSNACEFLSFPFVAFPYGSHMPLSRGGPCPWEQTPNLPGKLCEPIWALVMCKIKKLEHVCQPLCNVAAVVVVFNVSVIWVSINILLPCCSHWFHPPAPWLTLKIERSEKICRPRTTFWDDKMLNHPIFGQMVWY